MKEKLKISKLVQEREIGKMLKEKIIFISVLFLLFVQFLFAENVMIEVSVDKRDIVLGNSIKLMVEIDSRIANDYELPKMPDFIVEQKKGYLKNGKQTYVYMLSPKTAGYFTIPEIKILDNVSKPIDIRVKEPDDYRMGKIKYTEGNSGIFTKARTDVTSVYVNQQLIYTLEFYTKFDLASNPNYTLPMFQDFWKSKPKIKSGYRLINGENYFTFSVSAQLYPMKEGKIVIDPAFVSAISLEGGKQVKRNLKTSSVEVKVYPLPETGKPDNFSGAVGRYKISSYVDKHTFMIKEPINLYVAITGDGNINSVVEPEIDLNEDIQKYATTYKVKDDGWQSTKTFKYVLLPLIEGQKIIPEITFSYFSPDSKNYVTIKTRKIDINIKNTEYIKKNDGNITFGDDENIEQSQKQNSKEISEIETNIKLKNYNFYFLNNKFLLLCILTPFLIVMILSLIYRLRIIFINKDKIKLNKQNSYMQSVKYLKEAEEYISKNDQDNFYYAINLSVRLYLQSKINMDYVNMLKCDLKASLKKNKIDENIIIDIEKILTDCELFMFSSIKSTTDYIKQTYSNVKCVFEKLDKAYEKNIN